MWMGRVKIQVDGPLGSDAYVWGWLAVHFGVARLPYGAVLALGARHRLGHFLVHVLAGLLLVLDVKFLASPGPGLHTS